MFPFCWHKGDVTSNTFSTGSFSPCQGGSNTASVFRLSAMFLICRACFYLFLVEQYLWEVCADKIWPWIHKICSDNGWKPRVECHVLSGPGLFFPIICLSSFIWEDGPYRHLEPPVFRTETCCVDMTSGLSVRSPTCPSLFTVGLYGIINA